MNSIEIVRSWKDEEYRFSLSDDRQSPAPGNPAGILALDDEDLVEVGGGTDRLTSLITYSLITTIFPPIWPHVTSPFICRYLE